MNLRTWKMTAALVILILALVASKSTGPQHREKPSAVAPAGGSIIWDSMAQHLISGNL